MLRVRTKTGSELDEFVERKSEMLRIDKHALDDELQEQPNTFFEVSDRLALEISRRDAAKTELQTVESIADKNIRWVASQENKKLTVQEIAAEVARDEEVINADRRVRDLSYNVNRLSALKEAFAQRAYALKDLASLYGANYFQASSVSGAKDRYVGDKELDSLRSSKASQRKG